jgi:hypothetical protein
MKILVMLAFLMSQVSMAQPARLPTERVKQFKVKYAPWLGQGNDLMSKIVDSKGAGDPSLQGTINVRTVLHGVLYRGGTAASIDPSYDPKSPPLDQMTLGRLCSEDYGSAIYLYESVFPQGPYSCVKKNQQDGYISYASKVPVEVTKEKVAIPKPQVIKEILIAIKESAENRVDHPIYIHCWSGRHSSGFMAAIALRQFCGFNGEEAARYWADGTDGASDYPSFPEGLKAFEPYAELMISRELQALICPQNIYHPQ